MKANQKIITEKWAFELKESFIKAGLYLQKQAEAGVAHSLVSPIPQLFLYDFPEKITKEMASVYNNALSSEWVQSSAKRLSALATVPLNDPEKPLLNRTTI